MDNNTLLPILIALTVLGTLFFTCPLKATADDFVRIEPDNEIDLLYDDTSFCSLAWNPNGSKLATMVKMDSYPWYQAERDVKIWDENCTLLNNFSVSQNESMSDLVYWIDNDTIVTISNRSLYFWNSDTGDIEKKNDFPYNISKLQWSSDYTKVAILRNDNAYNQTYLIYDVLTMNVIRTIEITNCSINHYIKHSIDMWIYALSLDLDYFLLSQIRPHNET